jgi:hypothetical protein
MIMQFKERLEKRVVRVIGERLEYAKDMKMNLY